MPTRATNIQSKETVSKPRNLRFFGLLYKLDLILLTIGLIIWIFVGSFFSLTIVDNLKAMAKQKVVDKVGQEISEHTSPQETDLEGVGKVNVTCVQSNVKPETIQKVVNDKGTANISADEKAKLESCVTSQATPSASPSAK